MGGDGGMNVDEQSLDDLIALTHKQIEVSQPNIIDRQSLGDLIPLTNKQSEVSHSTSSKDYTTEVSQSNLFDV